MAVTHSVVHTSQGGTEESPQFRPDYFLIGDIL